MSVQLGSSASVSERLEMRYGIWIEFRLCKECLSWRIVIAWINVFKLAILPLMHFLLISELINILETFNNKIRKLLAIVIH